MARPACRPWTSREVALLKRRYGFCPLADLAADLGRSANAVGKQARRLGLFCFRALGPHQERQVGKMRARGRSDGRIARELGVSASTVGRCRRRLGLPPVGAEGNRAGAAGHSRARNVRAKAMEYPRWVDYMASRRRLKYLARHYGCTTRAQAEVCLLLSRGGPAAPPLLAALLRGTLHRASVYRAVGQLRRFGVIRVEGGLATLLAGRGR